MGWRVLIDRIWRIWRTVSGKVTNLTKTVNRMMATPIWLKLMTYKTIRVFSMGRMIKSVQGLKPACTTGLAISIKAQKASIHPTFQDTKSSDCVQTTLGNYYWIWCPSTKLPRDWDDRSGR